MKILISKEQIFNLFLKSKIVEYLKKATLPGFDKIPIFDVTVFFIKGIINGSLSSRASATAFNFFMAIIPAIIFFFTLIPYIPIDNLQEKTMELLKDILPPEAYNLAYYTVIDLITTQRGGLMSFGFLLMIYYATSGFDSLSDAFNASYHSIIKRSFFSQKLVSFFLLISTSLLIILSLILLIFGQWFLNYLFNHNVINSAFLFYLLIIVKWIIFLALCFFGISIIYYIAPSKKNNFPFFSPGSIFATFLMFITILGFNFFIKNFSSYNILYGSVGTIMIIMLLLYVNSLVLIIGFELNASIYTLKKIHQNN